MRQRSTSILKRHSDFPSFLRQLRRSFAAVLVLGATNVLADGEVTVVDSHFEASTPFQYVEEGVTYSWGSGQDQILDGFYYQGHHHSQITSADKVVLQRVDIAGVATGEPCGIFAEVNANSTDLVASYPTGSGAAGNCDMAAALAGNVINRGSLDTFTNTGPAPKNIERVDFVYSNGILASLSDAGLDVGGHVVAEKRGNNILKIAAISALDSNGEPSAYGPLVTVNAAGCSDPDICYGITAVSASYSFLQSASIAPQKNALLLSGDTESMAMAFVSSRHLGLTTGQRYYGVSVFARDVDASVHNLLDPTTFPQDTADDYITLGDGADLYGGMASTYWDDESAGTAAGALVSGDVFVDANNNGVLDEGEAGIDGLAVTLYADSDNDGVFDPDKDELLLVSSTDANGNFVFPGIPDGYYFAHLEEDGGSIPAGLSVPEGSNPIGFLVQNGQFSPLGFALVGLQGDGVVEAAADTATVRQDVSTPIDVLANDSDPVGSGLTITSVSTPANGTAVEVDGKIVYTPNPGYNGPDSFTYNVTDGNSNTSTTTVDVEVLRFSDLNDNGLDDYEECGCTSIEIITGIHGAGPGGGATLWFLALVLVLPLRAVHKQRTGESA